MTENEQGTLLEEQENDKEQDTKTNTKAKPRRKNRSQGTQQEKQSNTQKQGEISKVGKPEDGEIDISPFISNPDGNIYAITGLPEEFIATLFAWVSRSPKSFKAHLEEALKEYDIPTTVGQFEALDEKARKFHEKWTVGYGHSSVAEHAVAHVGIEKVSRLASAELELSNTFYSITEYSQRYQKPERGGWHNPFEAGSPEYKKVEDFYQECFDAFEDLIDRVFRYLCEKEGIEPYPEKNTNNPNPKQFSKEVSTKRNALLKLAFEDARYVLPLSMYTQLGMTANGRAWRDGLAKLGMSKHKEVHEMSDSLRTEISKVLPVLLKYATPSQYQRNYNKRVQKGLPQTKAESKSHRDVALLSVESEEVAINRIVAILILQYKNIAYESALIMATNMPMEEKQKIITEMTHEMEHFDIAPDPFQAVEYKASFLVSEANWHQLLRHNRKTNFFFGDPTPIHGITVPPRIKQAGLAHLLKDIAQISKELYTELVEAGYEAEAEYVVLNAHKRRVYATFNLWEAYHLINLRTSEEAQWDIRETFESLYKQLSAVHPTLMQKAKRRLKL